MNLLDLIVKVGVNDEASQGIASIASKLTGELSTAAKAGALAVTGVAAAVVGAGSAFIGGVSDVAAYGDQIDKMSQKMGMSAAAYQEWDSVMRHSGTSMETMKAGMKTLANAVESGNEAFERIGLTQEQIAGMSQEDLFAATIQGLQGVESETERTYLAGQLLGRGATELGPLLNTSAEETQAMRDRVHELGGVMSDEAVKSAAAFQDSLQDMQTAFTGLKNNMLGQFLPAITTVMDGMQELAAGNYDEGLEQISEGVSSVVETIADNMPEFIARGGELVGAIMQGLVENFPLLVTALGEGIMQLLNGINENAPAMLDAAGQLFMGILTALVQVAPQILGSLLSLLASVVGYVLSHLPQMLAAGIELIGQLLVGIGNAVGEIGGKVGEVIQAGLNAVGQFVSDFFSAGADLIQGLLNGISNNIGAVADTILGGIRGAVDTVKRFLGIASPSKLFEYFGEMTMEGLAEGIEGGIADAEKAMGRAVEAVSGSAEFGISANGGMVPLGSGNTYITIGNIDYTDKPRIEGAVMNLLDELYWEAQGNVG